ncbi:MAG: phospholipase D-like domain-containing protein [Candidatus Hydrogenedentota bacterium]
MDVPARNVQLTWIVSHLGLIVGFIFGMAAIAHMLRQRRSPSGTIAWVLAILFLPEIGVPLYLLLSGRKMRRRAAEKNLLRLAGGSVVPLDDASGIDRLMRKYDLPGATRGNKLDVISNGEDTYAKFVGLIASAKESIEIATYVFRPDAVGRDIVERLAAKARDGVEVRVLIDSFGSMWVRRSHLRGLIEAGGRVSFFMPLMRIPWHGRTNLRNHRKIMIVDGLIVMTGGFNIGAEYMGPRPTKGLWEDLAVVIEGPAVDHFEYIFKSDWEFANGEPFRRVVVDHGARGDAVLQVVPSGPDTDGDPIYDGVMTAAFNAQERLWVVTPYFVPDEALSKSLELAAHRGVDVRIIVPRKSNHWTADLARLSYLRDLQHAGGRIFLHGGPMMHAKALLLDHDLAVVASANMDMRSLLLNYEVAVLIHSHDEIEVLNRWAERLIGESAEGLEQVNTFQEVGHSIVRMISPIL